MSASNIEFGLTLEAVTTRPRSRPRSRRSPSWCSSTEFLDRRVTQLSGGQRQRVAIARALVTEPDILLLDEPLSALDAHLRVRMQSEMKRLQQRLGISFVYVTHNQSEAFSMADRVVVMNKGRIEQIGSPEEIYLVPKTRFTAEFVGTNNIFDGKVVDMRDGLIMVQCADAIISAPSSERPPGKGSTVTLVVQADKVRSNPTGVPGENSLRAVLSGREFTGSQVIYYLETPSGGEVKMVAQEPFSQTERATIDMAMQLYWSPADTVVLRPGIVPGVENMPGRRSYVRAGSLIVVSASDSQSIPADVLEAAGGGFSPIKVVGIGIPLAYSLVFFAAPLVFLVVLGFWLVEDFQVVPAFSLENYLDIAQHMFARSNYCVGHCPVAVGVAHHRLLRRAAVLSDGAGDRLRGPTIAPPAASHAGGRSVLDQLCPAAVFLADPPGQQGHHQLGPSRGPASRICRST